jgi:hypothetical protein
MRRSSDIQASWLGSEMGLVAVAWSWKTRLRTCSQRGKDEAVKHS